MKVEVSLRTFYYLWSKSFKNYFQSVIILLSADDEEKSIMKLETGEKQNFTEQMQTFSVFLI